MGAIFLFAQFLLFTFFLALTLILQFEDKKYHKVNIAGIDILQDISQRMVFRVDVFRDLQVVSG